MKTPVRHLPLKTYRHGLELSAESEALLVEAMNRLNTEDYQEALKTALLAFLKLETQKTGEVNVWAYSSGCIVKSDIARDNRPGRRKSRSALPRILHRQYPQ